MSKRRVVGDRKFGKRGKLAVANDELFQLLALRMGDGSKEIIRMLMEMSMGQRAMIAATAIAAQHAFAQISGACLMIDHSNAVYDRAMKRKPKEPMPRQRGKGKWKRR